MTSYFVTGASSAIGRRVVERLAESGPVVALRHRTEIRSDADIRVVEGELGALSTLAPVIRSADVIVHLAGCTHAHDGRTYHDVNVDGTRDLLKQCRDDQHVVFASSRTAGVDAGEYARSKLDAEQLVSGRVGSSTILRCGEVVEPGSSEGITQLIQLAVKYRVLVDFRHGGAVSYAPIDRGSVVQAIVAAADARLDETLVVSMLEAIDVSDIGAALRGRGRRSVRIPVPVKVLDLLRPVLVPRLFVADQLARLVSDKPVATTEGLRCLGVEPPSLDQLVAAVADYRAEGRATTTY